VPRGTYASLEFIARFACTLEDAMTSLGRYYRLLNKGAEIAYVERGDLAGLEIQVHARADGWGRQLNEYTLALFHRITCELAPDWRPVNVWFSHQAPSVAATAALGGFFGVAPSFGAATCGFEGPEELVDQPLPTGDAELQQLLALQATQALEDDAPLAALASRVREEVRGRLGSGDLAIAAIAPSLGLTVRTLQRRLREEGLSYQDVLDGVRAQTAKDWLANKRRHVGELAGKLGYSDASAFDRAFRRWTGKSPSAWRGVTPA
jgi:AraC-like DNA-binding protein